MNNTKLVITCVTQPEENYDNHEDDVKSYVVPDSGGSQSKSEDKV